MFLSNTLRRFSAFAKLKPARKKGERSVKMRLEPLEDRIVPASFSEFVDPHPAPGNQFGADVLPLSTGNVVITSPFDNAGGTHAGAVYLFNGKTGALISTLTGSHSGDEVGYGGVTALSNGNFVISSPDWSNGTVQKVGAVTWGSGITGISGTVSAGNSLVGSATNDEVEPDGASTNVVALHNGNYVVDCSGWSNLTGAVTWGNGSSGVSGIISAGNSLVGSTAGDLVGFYGVTELSNGNYLVLSPNWTNGAAVNAGAVTWGSGTIGVSGTVSANNSLVGSTTGDLVGSDAGLTRVTVLSNGNYVVSSPNWATGAGAVTWGSGLTGVSGTISASNSLVGSNPNDGVGSGGVKVLGGGNYVVSSPYWANGSAVRAGAVTWGDGVTGVHGTVNAGNSLVGTTAEDAVGFTGVVALSNGNYVVVSDSWTNGTATDAGAVTWASGAGGVHGTINAGNSLVGSNAYDLVGGSGLLPLSNGNYVVSSAYWANGQAVGAGAVTWANGVTGVHGTINAGNSLVGSNSNDAVGDYIVYPLVTETTWSTVLIGTIKTPQMPAQSLGVAVSPGLAEP